MTSKTVRCFITVAWCQFALASYAEYAAAQVIGPYPSPDCDGPIICKVSPGHTVTECRSSCGIGVDDGPFLTPPTEPKIARGLLDGYDVVFFEPQLCELKVNSEYADCSLIPDWYQFLGHLYEE